MIVVASSDFTAVAGSNLIVVASRDLIAVAGRNLIAVACRELIAISGRDLITIAYSDLIVIVGSDLIAVAGRDLIAVLSSFSGPCQSHLSPACITSPTGTTSTMFDVGPTFASDIIAGNASSTASVDVLSVAVKCTPSVSADMFEGEAVKGDSATDMSAAVQGVLFDAEDYSEVFYPASKK